MMSKKLMPEVDTQNKTVYSADGKELQYDKLYMATGSSSFIPPIEGNDLEGVMTLRGLPNAEKIKASIAAGFISMEIASLLAETSPDTYNISIVELMDRPLPLMFDKDMSDSGRTYLEEKG